jgi:hypothetical protein
MPQKRLALLQEVSRVGAWQRSGWSSLPDVGQTASSGAHNRVGLVRLCYIACHGQPKVQAAEVVICPKRSRRGGPEAHRSPGRLPWATVLRRVFAIESVRAMPDLARSWA